MMTLNKNLEELIFVVMRSIFSNRFKARTFTKKHKPVWFAQEWDIRTEFVPKSILFKKNLNKVSI